MTVPKPKLTQHSLAVQLSTGLFQLLWGIMKYIPTPVGDVLRAIFLRLVLKRSRVPLLWIRTGVDIWWPEKIAIGICCINENVLLNGYGGITIGDYCLIGRGTSFFSGGHVFSDPHTLTVSQGLQQQPITVGDNVYFGINCTVLGGIKIGSNAVIGAGSVVNRDVPDNAVVAGVPARIIRFR